MHSLTRELRAPAGKQILIVKTSSLGDIVHALPAVSDLRRARPELALDWLVEEAFQELPALHPAIRQVLPCAVRRWRRNLLAASTRAEVNALKRRVRAQAYDAVLDLQGLLKSAWLASLAKVPVHGYDRPSVREPLAGLAYSHRHAVPRGLHAVERNRRLAAAAFGYALEGPPDYGLALPPAQAPAPYVVCLHATSRKDKCWPVAHWQQLLLALEARGMKALLPWGSPAERKRATEIAQASGSAEVLPASSLTALASLLAGAMATVGVDTGLMHLAAAVGCPVIALYLASDPGLTGACPGPAAAVNLGGQGQLPEVAAVLAAIESLARRR
ncbi:heptosyltransferase I [Planctomycetaceae bacterium]|nr:heptosyltransferase I [Planctomycetaceae bacterium]